MSIDKSWTTNPYRNHPEFQAGLKAFIEKSKSHLDSNGKLRCACEKCESFIPPVVLPSNEMNDLIDDVMWESRENDTDLDEGTANTSGTGVDDDFAQLLEEMETQLYTGCIFSSLEFLAKLMHIKVNNKWTDSSFDQLLELLQLAFPKGNKVPLSHYLAKKKLKSSGLGYESIHVCKNDCCRFWKEHDSLEVCPVCK